MGETDTVFVTSGKSRYVHYFRDCRSLKFGHKDVRGPKDRDVYPNREVCDWCERRANGEEAHPVAVNQEREDT